MSLDLNQPKDEERTEMTHILFGQFQPKEIQNEDMSGEYLFLKMEEVGTGNLYETILHGKNYLFKDHANKELKDLLVRKERTPDPDIKKAYEKGREEFNSLLEELQKHIHNKDSDGYELVDRGKGENVKKYSSFFDYFKGSKKPKKLRPGQMYDILKVELIEMLDFIENEIEEESRKKFNEQAEDIFKEFTKACKDKGYDEQDIPLITGSEVILSSEEICKTQKNAMKSKND